MNPARNVCCLLMVCLSPISSIIADEIRIVDQEVRFGTKKYAATEVPRAAPVIEQFRFPVPALPEKIQSPGGWLENAYSGANEQTVFQLPEKGRVLQLVETTRGQDDTDTGAMDYKIWYRVSADRGQTYSALKPLVQQGDPYDFRHPIEGVWVGSNSFVFGGPMIEASNGEILVPTYRWPVDEHRKRLNPHNAYTYMESGLLIGQWSDDGTDMTWQAGQFVRPTAEESTRGSDECAVIELDTPGHFLMVARGSNQNKPDFPGRKWVSFSTDFCRTWTKPVPWTTTQGETFFSPAALCTLIRSKKNGKIYWIGNITAGNPEGNYPRYPLLIGEVDSHSGLLIQSSLVELSTRHPEYDSEKMQLSNFRTMEDPKSHRLLITLTRMDDIHFPPTDDPKTWYQGPQNWWLVELPDKR